MGGANGTAIRVEGVRKSFGPQTVLEGIDLRVASGQTLVILGRSGTGKSVLLKLLIGLQKPDAGSIQLVGREITELGVEALNEVRRRVGFVFQYAALYDSLTVEQTVAFPLEQHTKLSRAERRDRAHALLAAVGMEDAAGKMPDEISGGMKKRVGLARALALDPEVMLFDEPTAGLDPITSAEIDELIQRLQHERRMSSVVVTHELHSARNVADRVALLERGKIVFEGTFDELTGSEDPFIEEFARNA